MKNTFFSLISTEFMLKQLSWETFDITVVPDICPTRN